MAGVTLEVKLFMGAVIALAFDAHGFLVVQTGPPTFQFDLWQQQHLSTLVDRAVNDSNHQAKGPGLFAVGAFEVQREQRFALARTLFEGGSYF